MLILLVRPGVPGVLATAGGVARPGASAATLAGDADTPAETDGAALIATELNPLPPTDAATLRDALYGDDGRAGESRLSTSSLMSLRDETRGCE